MTIPGRALLAPRFERGETHMSFGETVAPALGRAILAWFFLSDAYMRAINWDATIALLAARDLPAPPVLHFVTLMVITLGALALLIGYHARLGALVLFAFLSVSNVFMNDYWNIGDPAQRQAVFDVFARNLAIGGGLLMVMGIGPGRFAIERD
jgi:putative oxidoreductase